MEIVHTLCLSIFVLWLYCSGESSQDPITVLQPQQKLPQRIAQIETMTVVSDTCEMRQIHKLLIYAYVQFHHQLGYSNRDNVIIDRWPATTARSMWLKTKKCIDLHSKSNNTICYTVYSDYKAKGVQLSNRLVIHYCLNVIRLISSFMNIIYVKCIWAIIVFCLFCCWLWEL